MIIDVSRTSSFGKIHFRSHRSRNVRSANHFQTISPYISLKYTKKDIFWFALKLECPIIPLFLRRVQSAMLNPAFSSVPNPNNPTVLET